MMADPHHALVVRFDSNQPVLEAVIASACDFAASVFGFQKVERGCQKVNLEKCVPVTAKVPVH